MCRPLQYSVRRFRTAMLSVRMFPLMSAMSTDLSCWVLVRALRVLLASLRFPVFISVSGSFHCSSIHSPFSAFIFFLATLFTFLYFSNASVLVCFCRLSWRFRSHRSRTASVTQGLICFPCLPRTCSTVENFSTSYRLLERMSTSWTRTERAANFPPS